MLAAMPASAALGANSIWTFNGSGNWTVTSNWLGGVPASASDVFVTNNDALSRTINYDYTGASIQFNSLTIENSTGSAVFSQSGNTFNSLNEKIGNTAGSTGYWSLSGGTHNITLPIPTNGLNFGLGTLSRGIGTISGGSLSAPGAALFVGYWGAGTLTQTGGTNTSFLVELGAQASGSGVYNLSAGTLIVYQPAIGYAGSGTMNMSGGTLGTSSTESIAYYGTGVLNQSGGVHVVNGDMLVGVGSLASGSCVTSGTASLTVNGSMYLGGDSATTSGGAGNLQINGGSVRVTNKLKVYNNFNSYIHVFGGTLAAGTIDLAGSPLRLTFGSGTLSITDPNAVLTVDPASTSLLGYSVYLDGSMALSVAGAQFIGGGAGGGSFINNGGLNAAGNLAMLTPGGYGARYDLVAGTLAVTNSEIIGDGFGSSVFNQGGGANSAGALMIGAGTSSSCIGTFNLSAGSLTVSNFAAVGNGTSGFGGTGALNITGGTATFNGPGLFIWDTGAGTTTGGHVTLAGGQLNVATLLFAAPGGGYSSNGASRFTFSLGTLNFLGSLSMAAGGPFSGTVGLTFGKSLIVAGTTSVDGNAPLVLDGGTFSTGSLSSSSAFQFNSGTLRLTGSSLNIGAGGLLGNIVQLNSNQHLELTNANSITVAADGLLFINGGTALSSGTLQNAGQIQLAGPAAQLSGGTLMNSKLVTGTGRIFNTLNNQPTGEVRVGLNDNLQFRSGGSNNSSGKVTLAGGVLEFTGQFANLSTGSITGRGTVITAGLGLINNGTMALSAGYSDISGNFSNNGTVILTGGSTTTFYNNVVSSASTTFRISAGSRAVFLGTVTGTANFSGAGIKDFESSASPGPLASVAGSTYVGTTGTLTTPVIREATFTIDGAATILPDGSVAATSRVEALDIGAGGKLDLNDNSLIIDYAPAAPSPIASIANQIQIGYAGGAWTGNGITSSSAAAAASSQHKTAVGYAETSSLGVSTFSGQSVDATAVLIRYTFAGDGNLDGKVDLTDFTFLAANFNGANKTWLQGDYNYDGNVNLTDFTFLASNFNQSLPAPEGIRGSALVPEPGAALGLTIGAALSSGRMRRRRPRHCHVSCRATAGYLLLAM